MLKTLLALGLFIGGVNAWSQSAFIGPTVPQGATVTVGAITALGTLTNNTSGNAGTASAFAATPTPCSSSNAPTGVLANGNSTGCTAYILNSLLPASGTLVGVTDTQTLTNKTLAFPTSTQGDVTGTPGFSQTVTSTNSGGTAGITSGDECQITHAFASGSTYSAIALCVTTASLS